MNLLCAIAQYSKCEKFMAQVIVMPKLGNTVESSIILSWQVNVGDTVNVGDILCEIETDKATLEVESSEAGILLARFYEEGDDVPVLENLAVIGQTGEAFDEFIPDLTQAEPTLMPDPEPQQTISVIPEIPTQNIESEQVFISPRARNLAIRKKLDYMSIQGTGPNGRIIERDIELALANQVKVSPVAKAMLDSGEFAIGDSLPAGSKITKTSLIPVAQQSSNQVKSSNVNEIPLKGIRKTIARRMLESIQTTAQLTLNSSADARAVQAYRKRLKASDASLGLTKISINDLVMFAVAQTLPQFPEMNALFENDTLYQYGAVHLGMAVDTPRGLIVPVIHNANKLSLKQLAGETHRLANACLEGKIKPDEMAGGTFTVTNLGGLGIESFTPVLNLPQVAILGVGNINLKPVQQDKEVAFVPHMGLSLTINHQVVDGAPGARFLSQLSTTLANIDLMLAL